jgi:putative hemolysin
MLALIIVACGPNSTTPPIVGGDKDAHGCLPSAGYSWCDAKQKCLRQFEEPCNSTDPNSIGLANPASVNCEKIGGKVDIRDGTGGQYGVCVFTNGTECEEWALFRGEGCTLPAVTPQPDETGFIKCPEPRAQPPVACTMDYNPVCGVKDTGVRCVRAPCPMASENVTFGNACGACADPKVYGYYAGPCYETKPVEPTPQPGLAAPRTTVLCPTAKEKASAEAAGFVCVNSCAYDNYKAQIGLTICVGHFDKTDALRWTQCATDKECSQITEMRFSCVYALKSTDGMNIDWSGSKNDSNDLPADALRCAPSSYTDYLANSGGILGVDENGGFYSAIA